MPSRRQQRRSLAIGWMTMIVAVSLAGVARARDDIATLFEGTPSQSVSGHVSNRTSNIPSDKRRLRNSLSSLPGPDVFEEAESIADTESDAPRPRFKRIADPMDSPHQRSRKRLQPHLGGRRRPARRMFRRFALEESNPADESESEYANIYDDDVDLPGAFLNDELSKKRNQFEDVYPELSQLPKPQHSPPDFLKRPIDINDMVRKKRNREEEEQEEEADCADGAHEEYYYEDEAPEVSRPGNNKRASQSSVDYIDGEQKMDRRNSEAISAVNSNRLGIDKNSKPYEKERIAPLTANTRESVSTGKSIRNSAKEKSQLQTTNTAMKISAAKSSSNLVKRKSQKKPTKEKKRPKPKAKPKPKSKSKPKPKPKPKPKKPKPRKKPKSIAKVQSSKLSSDCCEEDADRSKREKTLVIKAVPKGKNINELQIYQKTDVAKKKAVSKFAEKQSSAKDLTALSISEVKDLLGKLMVKIDNLRDLVSELTNGRREVHIEDTNEKLTSPQAASTERTSCRRRWDPWTRQGVCSVTWSPGAQSRSCLAGCRHVSFEGEKRVCSHSEARSKFLGIF